MTDIQPHNIKTKIISGFNGVLVIGDPLLGPHKRVGRTDDVWAAGLDKLSQALEMAKNHQLLPLIVGDILHDAREIGQLLPIFQMLKGRNAVLLPRNGKWADRNQGNIAAILEASGIASVAGHTAKNFQIPIQHDGSWLNITLEAHTSWGGEVRLEPGEKGCINIPELGIMIKQTSGMSTIDTASGASTLEMGRMLRLTHAEEKQKVSVFSLTVDGIQVHDLNTTPIVFSDNAVSALEKNIDLNRDSLFVDKLRASTQEVMEDEGKESLLDLINQVCREQEADTWLEEVMLSLAKEAVEA